MTTNATTVNEKSPLCLTMTFTDEDGAPLVPISLDWRLDDLGTDEEIVAWTPVSTPAAVMKITIPADNNVIGYDGNIREPRVFGIRINDGAISEAHAEYHYHVINLTGPSGA